MFDEFETVAEHVADSLWLSTVADAVDRAADDGDETARDFRPGAGGDWKDTDYRPVPAPILAAARRILGGLPHGILAAGRTAWRDLTGCDDERFGHVVAMRILCTGVGLNDDLPPSRAGMPLARDLAYRDVLNLSQALPRLDCSAEFAGTWNPETGKVEL